MTNEIQAGVGRRGLSREGRRRLLGIAVHAAALFPLAWLVFDFWLGYLGPEPVRAMILRLGKAAIMAVPKGDATDFIGLGGRIPAPIHSLKN